MNHKKDILETIGRVLVSFCHFWHHNGHIFQKEKWMIAFNRMDAYIKTNMVIFKMFVLW